MRYLLIVLLAACSYRTVDSVAIRGGGEARRRALAEAVRQTEQIWRSPVFWDLVEQHVWIPGPGQAPITGAQLRLALEDHHPLTQRYRLVWFLGRKVWTAIYTRANAEASACQPIEILRRRVPMETLVDTIAHENTHVAKIGGACTTRYLDGQFSRYELPWLVSYGIGDLALCFATSGGDPARANACFAQVVNATYACRTYAQCHLGGDDVPDNVKQARSHASQCKIPRQVVEALCEWYQPP